MDANPFFYNYNYNIIITSIKPIICIICKIAPATAPTNVSLLTVGPQSINVTICPPAAIDQNGLILSYNVSYTGDPFDTLIQSQSFAVSLSYPATACVNVTLTGLEEFNNYTVSVQAVNSAGSGDSSAGVITQTDAAGSY